MNGYINYKLVAVVVVAGIAGFLVTNKAYAGCEANYGGGGHVVDHSTIGSPARERRPGSSGFVN